MSERLAQRLEKMLFEAMKDMSRDDLKRALNDCDWCTHTNCGWLEFNLAPIVRDAVANQIQLLDEASQAS